MRAVLRAEIGKSPMVVEAMMKNVYSEIGGLLRLYLCVSYCCLHTQYDRFTTQVL